MKLIKYFLQSLIIYFLFLLYRLLGYKFASSLSSLIFHYIGPFFRSKQLIKNNILRAFPNLNTRDVKKISDEMWKNYGKILCEYMFIKKFRHSKTNNHILIIGKEILTEIKKSKNPVIFISGHFDNFELMAMTLEKEGIDLAAIYRPLNNIFLNYLMEKIRKKYICKNQIKKGITGTKKLLQFFKQGTSIALMIDQRVSQGIKSNFFNQEALTTTIPAQFVKKYNCNIVPIYIERIKGYNFQLKIYKPIKYPKNESISSITLSLNKILEKMVVKNPGQWIWSHNRWKI